MEIYQKLMLFVNLCFSPHYKILLLTYLLTYVRHPSPRPVTKPIFEVGLQQKWGDALYSATLSFPTVTPPPAAAVGFTCFRLQGLAKTLHS